MKEVGFTLDRVQHNLRLEDEVIALIEQRIAERPPSRPARGKAGVGTWITEVIHDELGLSPGESYSPPVWRRIRAHVDFVPGTRRAGAGEAGWVRALVYDELGLGEPPDPYEDRRGNPHFGGRGNKRGSEPVEAIPGEAIAAARAKAGLSQSELAKVMGIATNTVAQYEKRGVKTPATVGRVREALAGHL